MRQPTSAESECRDRAAWNAALARLGGDLLQSWEWGELKRRHGWQITRLHLATSDGEAMAQVLFRPRGPLTVAYVPRGPLVLGGAAVAADLLRAIDAACRHRRAGGLIIEPGRLLPAAWTDGDGSAPFEPGPRSFQTERTVRVPLSGDEQLLARMRRDTRSNISHARKRGVTVERTVPTASDMEAFYRLLQETSNRNGFGIRTRSYYEDFVTTFGDGAVLLLARDAGSITAGLIAARFGSEGRSMYAGSSTSSRGRGDAALLRLEAMRWARDLGCSSYDMGGIAPHRSSILGSEELAGSAAGTGLDGVQQFKLGFGGVVVDYPRTLERRYHPLLLRVVRLAYSRFRVDSLRSDTSTPSDTGFGSPSLVMVDHFTDLMSANGPVLQAASYW